MLYKLHWRGDPDAFRRDEGPVSENLDTRADGLGEGLSVDRVDGHSRGELVTILSIDEVEHHGAVTGPGPFGQVHEVAGAARCDRVGEEGGISPSESDVLGLDEAQPARELEEEVHAASASIGNLAAQAAESHQLRDQSRYERLLENGVGPAGVDPYPGVSRTDQFQGVWKLPPRPITPREPDFQARQVTSHHRPGVGAVGGEDLSVIELDVCKESLVPADQSAGDEGRWEAHGSQT